MRLKKQQRYPKSETKVHAAMIANAPLCPCQVCWSWVHAPLRKICQFCKTPLKLHAKTC